MMNALLGAGWIFGPRRLGARPGQSTFTFERLISGIAALDLYHAGQIRLLRRLWEERAG